LQPPIQDYKLLDYHKWREIATVAHTYALVQVRRWKAQREESEREKQRELELAALSRVKSFHMHLTKVRSFHLKRIQSFHEAGLPS
jgi:hypothetical protein